MLRRVMRTGGCCLLLFAGCTQSTEELRTYSEGTDGSAAIAQLGDSRDTDESAATGRPGGAGETPPPALSPAAKESEAAQGAAPIVPSAEQEVAVNAAPTRPPRVAMPIRLASAGGSDGTSFTSLTAADKPREIKLLVPEKDFPRLDGGKTWRVSFDDIDLLKVLNMEPVPADCVEHFPDWLKSLDGQQIRIRGFMIPDTRAEGLTGFNMARDTQLCCFGRAPKLYDVFPVWLKPGTTTKYIHLRPFDVVGRFAIRPYAYKGELQSLYEIEDAELIPN